MPVCNIHNTLMTTSILTCWRYMFLNRQPVMISGFTEVLAGEQYETEKDFIREFPFKTSIQRGIMAVSII